MGRIRYIRPIKKRTLWHNSKEVFQCYVCEKDISAGQSYFDGGPGNVAHYDCGEEFKDKLEEWKRVVARLKNRP